MLEFKSTGQRGHGRMAATIAKTSLMPKNLRRQYHSRKPRAVVTIERE